MKEEGRGGEREREILLEKAKSWIYYNQDCKSSILDSLYLNKELK